MIRRYTGRVNTGRKYIGTCPSTKYAISSGDALSASVTMTSPRLVLPATRPMVSASRRPSRRNTSVPSAWKPILAANAAASVNST